MATETLLVFFILFTLNNVINGEVCFTRSRYVYAEYSYEYCPSGCCGYYYSNACCTANVGMIIGLVIGGITFLSFAVVVIIIIACHKKNRHIGVVHAAPPIYGSPPNPLTSYSNQPPLQPYSNAPPAPPVYYPGPSNYPPTSDPVYPPNATTQLTY